MNLTKIFKYYSFNTICGIQMFACPVKSQPQCGGCELKNEKK